jgi:hypothetical protein
VVFGIDKVFVVAITEPPMVVYQEKFVLLLTAVKTEYWFEQNTVLFGVTVGVLGVATLTFTVTCPLHGAVPEATVYNVLVFGATTIELVLAPVLHV